MGTKNLLHKDIEAGNAGVIHLNDRQFAIVQVILSNKVSLIKGPAGLGKFAVATLLT